VATPFRFDGAWSFAACFTSLVVLAVLTAQPALAATTGSQRAALAAAAHGTYASPLGTLEFHDDGTADFDLVYCGVEDKGPGRVVTLVTSCDNAHVTASGPVTVQDHSFDVRDASGTLGFDAYVDDDGALHVGTGNVGYLGRRRRGTAHLASENVELSVANGTCRETNPFDKKPVTGPCKFVSRDGRDVLLYRGRDPFHPKRSTQKGLVYLPGTGLLVDVALEAAVFTPSSP
jgi:hypothetical protein